MPEPPSLDAAQIGVGAEVAMANNATALPLLGGAGAATPGCLVTATDLDATRPAAATTAGEDGSFKLSVRADVGDLLRLQCACGEEHSEPVDLLVSGGGVLQPYALPACVTLSPALWFSHSSDPNPELSLHNGCADTLTLLSSSLRLGNAGWQLEPLAFTSDITPGLTVPLQLSSTTASPGADELLLVLRLGQSEYRAAVSLF